MGHTTHTCSFCNTSNTSVFEGPTLLLCKHCGSIVLNTISKQQQIIPLPVPSDWSFIQLQTTGVYNKQPFRIVGRIRLQLRNDYKNFWCAALSDGRRMWLIESFASFAILNPAWQTFLKKVNKLQAGKNVLLTTKLKVTGEFVEKCEGVSYEGEISGWKLFHPGFFFIQASNSDTKEIAIFIIEQNGSPEYLTGVKTEANSLELKNIIQWDEWK